MVKTYYCRECEVSTGPLTDAEAEVQRLAGHTLFRGVEPMPARDAIADAEQLEGLVFAAGRGRDRRAVLDNLRRAAAFGRTAIGWIDSDDLDCVVTAAHEAAHCAFVAVPALRAPESVHA